MNEGWEARSVYGDMTKIEGCGMAMIELIRK